MDQNDEEKKKKEQQQQMISTGSPESAPMPVQPESTPQQVEYGNEVLRRIESGSEHALEMAERKEQRIQEDPRQSQPRQMPPAQQSQSVSNDPQPKYFGYNISPQIANNTNLIRSNSGKGDPNSSRTWVYVLLDKMLKKRTN